MSNATTINDHNNQEEASMTVERTSEINAHVGTPTADDERHPALPFLKWAGGKRKLLPKLQGLRPKYFGNYHEPFLGGGAHYFSLRSSGHDGRCFLHDLNQELVQTYSAVQQSPRLVLDGLYRHAACHCESYFHALRDMDCTGMLDHEIAARMIYLNKASNNGLYRVNRKGKFNSAWGKHDRSNIDEVVLFRASSALQSAIIRQGDFSNVLNDAKAGDFAFMDPPYPHRFNQYTALGFGNSDQHRLHSVCVELARNNVRFIQTNLDCSFIRDLYKDFEIVPVEARWSISCAVKGRGPVGEVIVMNY